MREPARLEVTTSQKSWLDRLWRRVNSMRMLPGRGYRITQTPDGVRLDIDPGKGGGSAGELQTIRLCRNGTQIEWEVNSPTDPTTLPEEDNTPPVEP